MSNIIQRTNILASGCVLKGVSGKVNENRKRTKKSWLVMVQVYIDDEDNEGSQV